LVSFSCLANFCLCGVPIMDKPTLFVSPNFQPSLFGLFYLTVLRVTFSLVVGAAHQLNPDFDHVNRVLPIPVSCSFLAPPQFKVDVTFLTSLRGGWRIEIFVGHVFGVGGLGDEFFLRALWHFSGGTFWTFGRRGGRFFSTGLLFPLFIPSSAWTYLLLYLPAFPVFQQVVPLSPHVKFLCSGLA